MQRIWGMKYRTYVRTYRGMVFIRSYAFASPYILLHLKKEALHIIYRKYLSADLISAILTVDKVAILEELTGMCWVIYRHVLGHTYIIRSPEQIHGCIILERKQLGHT